MGIGSHNRKHLSSDDIDKLNKPYHEKIFNRFKNSEGYMRAYELKCLLNPRNETKIEDKIIKRLVKICCSEDRKLSLYDFKYFYAIMMTHNSNAKRYFMADLIFAKNPEINIEKYKRRVEMLYKNQVDFLKSDDFIQPKLKTITKEHFLKKISCYEIPLEKFHYFKIVKSHIDINVEILPLQGIRNCCRCIAHNLKDNQLFSATLNKDKLDEMERIFKGIENSNNGVFPINYLETILVEIDMNPTIISLIISFLKTKTQKSFIDFKNFKELISKLSSEYSEKINYFFTILAYPNKHIEKGKLVKVIQNLNKNLKHNEIITLLVQYNINKDLIPFSEFEIFFIENFSLISSLERIMYIPYLYFKIKPSKKEIEKRCIEIITKGEKDLSNYIKSIIMTESEFYIIDSNFWNSWKNYVGMTEKVQESNNINSNGKEDINKSYVTHFKPRIDLTNLVEYSSKLKQGLLYQKDFVIVNKRIWDLLSFWYYYESEELKRYRIKYQVSDQFETRKEETKELSLLYVFSKIRTELVYNNENNTVYEIEVYPIFMNFMIFDEILNKLKKSDIEEFKNHLSKVSINKNYRQFKTYSRLTKFSEVKAYMEKVYKLVNNTKSRLWIFYEGHVEMITHLEKNFIDENILNYCIMILETKNNNKWPSEILEQDNNYSISNTKTNLRAYVGIMNIGNTCFMNAAFQIIINLEEIKSIFTHPEFYKCINVKNKSGIQGKLMNEFINICKEKWFEEHTKTLNLRRFKEIVSEIKSEYRGNNQHDAHDFLTFILDILHEEINLKSEKEYILNPQIYNGTDEELANEYWANNLRRNFSFIHSFFLGQLKSNLSCQVCGNVKKQFETFLTLNLPISQIKKISINVILHRLPFTFKIYYNELQNKSQNNNYKDMENKENSSNLREYLSMIRKKSLDIHLIDHYENEDNEENLDTNINSKILKMINGNKDNHSYKNSFYTSKLATSIPLKLNVEIDRKLTVEKLIETIKSYGDLDLEKDGNYTEFLVYDLREIINQKLNIDECIQHNQTIHIYELLNSNGIDMLLNYKIEEDKKLIKLNDLSIFHFNKGISSSEPFTKQENYEFIIEVKHRYPFQLKDYLFKDYDYNYIDHFNSVMIFRNKKSIKTVHLYEYIFEKYEYVLNNSSKLEKNFDFKKNTKENISTCSPFTLSLVNRKDLSCPFCIWYKFCSGCVLDPKSINFLYLNPTYIIMVNWCNDVVKNEMNESLFKLTLNHISLKSKEEENNEKTLDECLNLFIEKEDLGDQNQIMCSNCNKHQNFYKKFDIERLPPVLILVPKRFKYTKMYRTKIDSYIDFPLYDLDLSPYMTDKSSKINTKYDLFGIINHTGSLSGGHYTSIVKHQDKWIKYDDSSCYDINENSVKTNQAYILIYRRQISDEENNYLKLLNSIYFKRSDEFIIGEPLKTQYGKGYLLEKFSVENVEYYTIKHKYGHTTLNNKTSKIEKELSYSHFEENWKYRENMIKPKNFKDTTNDKPQKAEGLGCIVY